MFDFSFETNSAFVLAFFDFAFPIFLAMLYLFFGFLVYRSERKTSTRKIAVIFIFIALFLLSSVLTTNSLWIPAVGAGILLILSILLTDLLLPNLENQAAVRSAKFVLILLSCFVLLTQLVINLLNIDWVDFGNIGLVNFWTGLLLFISFFLVLFRRKNLLTNQNISILDFYNPVILFSFLPIGIWLIVATNQNLSKWFFIPLLFGLLWFAVYFIAYQKEQSTPKIRKIKGLPLCLGFSSAVGLLIFVILFFQRTYLFSDIQFVIIISLYVFGFSLVFLAYLFLFNSKSSAQLKISEDKKFVPSNFESKDDLIIDFRKSIFNQINPAGYLHFSFDSINQVYRPQSFPDTPDCNLSFSLDSRLVQKLKNKDQPLIFLKGESLQDDLIEEKEMLALLAADSIIPIKAEGQLLGWVSLSLEEKDLESIQRKTNKILATVDEYAYQIKKMDDQMKLELREKNFDVLSRIVQGVNYTLALDDIYELIFAQTSQVIPSNDFFIVLKEENSQKLRSVFHIELDERFHEEENQFILLSNSVEADVIKRGRGVVANNYPEFCQSRKFDSHRDNVTNALVAPLNTGDKTIGCIFLANRNSEDLFSIEQLDLLQSIADLVAGAIEKARLLIKTQLYAHQLSALNDLLRKLSSIINIDLLLKSFLDFANELIEFEESRLITLDENSELLLYKEVKGEKSLPLKNKKYSSSEEVYDTISSTKSIIVVDQNAFPDDSIYAFYKNQNISIQSLMVIPLVIKEKVYGFIELINRKDDHIFSENDKQLMQTFAVQAAITWENARLYQQTDQELADRVQELSTMQKIDRELNTSLDIQTTLEITLSWAMKWLNAGAGWIGLVKDDWVTDIKYAGFENEANQALPETISFSKIECLKVDQQFSTRKLIPNELEKFQSFTLEQIFSPIFREDHLVAVIVLELFDEIQFTINEKKFLERLSDHASIALMNGQFYEEIQKANLAKSEFVSLVAHELKNPMTSIKGYTELMTTGAAGQMSETQSNFLSIIRNNTDRMNALVSDLNDLTKIETGNIHLEPKPTQIDEIVDDVVRSIKKQIEEKNQTLSVNILNQIPSMNADPIRLTQILTNLLSNANKYTKEYGNISLFAEKTKEPAESGSNDDVAHIWVEDTGIGISNEDQQLIFQKFFRSEDQNVRAVSGTGLGLNITRSLIELMGGSIWFESESGKGTTFHVVVPLLDD